MTSDKSQELATEIADYVFQTTGFKPVERVAAFASTGTDLGGWTKATFRERIAAIIAKHKPEPVKANDDKVWRPGKRYGTVAEMQEDLKDANGYLAPIKITNGPDAGKTFVADIYDIVDSIGYRNLAQAQAAKKILRGGRSDKDWQQDMNEAIDSLRRAIEREATR